MARQQKATLEQHVASHKELVSSQDHAEQSEAVGHQRAAIRILSSSGQGCHDWVGVCPSAAATTLNDSEWLFAARWRLGLAVMREGSCQQKAKAATDSERCGRACDRLGDHALLCGKGGGRYRVHGAVGKCYGRFGTEAGAEVDYEEVCPQLIKGEPGSDAAEEARMDVHIWSHGTELMEEWIDVTASHPGKQSTKQRAMVVGGCTAEQIEEVKRKRYGTGTGGVACSPAGLELWGRLGGSACAVLERLAALHEQRHQVPRHVTLQRWRAELGCALMRALAATVAKAAAAAPQASHCEHAHLHSAEPE